MRFRVIGGPLTSAINLEAKHTDTFKSIFKKAQKGAGKKTPLDGYDFFTSIKTGVAGHYAPAAGPLRSTDTPDSLQLDRKQKDPHVLLLVPREGTGDACGRMARSLSHSNSASYGGSTGDAASQEGTCSASMSPMLTPRAVEGYRRRMQAMFLKYDPDKINKVDLALERYAGYEEDVIQQLVKKYGPEPAEDEIDTSRAAIARAMEAAAGSSAKAGAAQTTASASKNVNCGASYHDRLVAIYSTYEPEKLSKVGGTLKRYAGREEEVIQQLVKKYGPEPPVSAAAASPATPTITAVTSPEPREPAATEVPATPTTNTMSEAPQTPSYVLTPMTSSSLIATAAADSLPITPRNLQDEYSSNSTSNSTSATPPAVGSLTYQDRLTAMYATYDPDKIRLVEGTLKKYKGREAAVLKQLVKMYGPEPSPEHVAAAKEAALAAVRARKSSDAAATTSAFASASAPSPTVEEPAETVTTEVSAMSLPAVMTPSAVPAAVGKQEQTVKAMPAVNQVASSAVIPAPVVIEALSPSPAEVTAAEAAVGVSASSPLSPPTEKMVQISVATAVAPPLAVEEVKEEEAQHEDETEENEVNVGGRYRERLVALYHAYNPSKLHTVEGTLKKFAGKEEAAIQQLVRRYGPEPPALSIEEAYELLKSVGGSSPMMSPRSHNPSVRVALAEVPDNNSSASLNSSKPVSPVEQMSGEYDGYRHRVYAILAAHDPEKVDKVDLILSRYQGKEEEVIAKLEQRYGARGGDMVEASLEAPARSSAVPPPTSSELPAAPAARASMPLPAPVAVEVATAAFSPAAVTPAEEAASPPSPSPPSPSSPAKTKALMSDDDATRPTAPPSQRSSSRDSSTSSTPPPTPPPPQEKGAEWSASTMGKTLRTAGEPAALRTPAPPAVEQPVVVSIDVVEQTLPPATTAAIHPPVKSAQHPPQVKSLPLPQRRLVTREKKFSAAAQIAAEHVEASSKKTLLQRYWSNWHRHHRKAKADALVRDELWVVASANGQIATSGKGCYRLNDEVQPPYLVSDLATIVDHEARNGTGRSAAFSSEMEIAARALLSALRHCVESRVVEVRSAEEEALASRFLEHWAAAAHLCPVTDSPEFSLALHQAAHLIAQLDDLMTVIRTQAGQLQQLRNLHKDVLQRMKAAQANSEDVDSLRAQLESANAQRRELKEELKRVSSTSRLGGGQKAGEGRKTSPPTRRVYTTIEERKDAQIAKLQQELAKTRNSLFASKEAEEKMKVQVQQSLAREARRERDEHRREGLPGRHSRPVSFYAQGRSHSNPAGLRRCPSSGPSSPHRGGGYQPSTSTTPRGAFSHAIVLDTPRRPSESAARVEYNSGRAVSSIHRSGLDAQDRSSVSMKSNTPWPTSRFVMTEEVERGPCPNCLTPLTSCSADARGPANAKAAFCFSCRRSFTFGELHARDIRDAVENL
jgi:hypothetical protein